MKETFERYLSMVEEALRKALPQPPKNSLTAVSYTHLRAHET